MSEAPNLSEAKRALLEKYQLGERVRTTRTARTVARCPSPSADSRAPLIPIQTSGSQRPLFYFHIHWIGGAFYSFPLAHLLGPDQPLYLLDPYKFDGLTNLPSFESMAAEYVTALREVQPEGPYSLGGFCAGGLVAMEVAQQLRAAGQEIDPLILIEPSTGPIEMIRFLGKYIRRFGSLLRLSEQQQVDLYTRIRHFSRMIRGKNDEYTQDFSPFSPAQTLQRDWMSKFFWIISSYITRPYNGNIVYLWASEKPTDRKVWGDQVVENEHVKFYNIAGSNVSCRTEHLDDLGRHIKMCLDARSK